MRNELEQPAGQAHALHKQMAARFIFGTAKRWRMTVADNTPGARARGLRFYNALLTHQHRKEQSSMDRQPVDSDQQAPALPTDAYSIAYRSLCDHPEAVRSSSTLTLADFFGRSETWVIESFWLDGSASIFVQRMAAQGAFRLLLPPVVTDAIAAQRDRVVTGARKKRARNVVARRRASGEVLGNAAALVKARAARARKPAGSKPGRKKRGRPAGSKNRPKVEPSTAGE